MEIGHSCPCSASLWSTIGAWNMCAADEQNATSPPFEPLDAFHLVTSVLRPPSNIQCLHKSLNFGFENKKCHSKTYLSVPYFRNSNNMTTIMRGDTWRRLLLKFRQFLVVGSRVVCCLFLHLYAFLRVVLLHDICRVERLDGKRRTVSETSPCRLATLLRTCRRSCNSTPSSIRLFRV